MNFGIAGLDFCVRNQYRNREKFFFRRRGSLKKIMHPYAYCAELDIKHEPPVLGGLCLCMKKLV